uniref:Uncharacterized protein n=1 Tax=Knipowitschia caucasica TaxID=637954 RepID=A0AAV2KWZ1_KNICA
MRGGHLVLDTIGRTCKHSHSHRMRQKKNGACFGLSRNSPYLCVASLGGVPGPRALFNTGNADGSGPQKQPHTRTTLHKQDSARA